MGDWRIVLERRGRSVQIVVSDLAIPGLLDACASGATIGEIAENPRLKAAGLCELLLRGWIGSLIWSKYSNGIAYVGKRRCIDVALQ